MALRLNSGSGLFQGRKRKILSTKLSKSSITVRYSNAIRLVILVRRDQLSEHYKKRISNYIRDVTF